MSTAMIAMTTSSSIRVNPRRPGAETGSTQGDNRATRVDRFKRRIGALLQLSNVMERVTWLDRRAMSTVWLGVLRVRRGPMPPRPCEGANGGSTGGGTLGAGSGVSAAGVSVAGVSGGSGSMPGKGGGRMRERGSSSDSRNASRSWTSWRLSPNGFSRGDFLGKVGSACCSFFGVNVGIPALYILMTPSRSKSPLCI